MGSTEVISFSIFGGIWNKVEVELLDFIWKGYINSPKRHLCPVFFRMKLRLWSSWGENIGHKSIKPIIVFFSFLRFGTFASHTCIEELKKSKNEVLFWCILLYFMMYIAFLYFTENIYSKDFIKYATYFPRVLVFTGGK